MKDNPEVNVIVVTLNRREDLAEAIESLHQQTYGNIEVIVVDNGSSDGTAEMLRESCADVKLLELGRNTGPYHARNVGADASKGDIIFFLDDDATLSKDAIAKIVDRFSKEETLGVIVCKLIQLGSGAPESVLFSKLANTPDVACYLGDMVAEGAMAIRRHVFERAGRWPAHYFRSHVGKDLSYRVIDAGFNIAYLPTAIVSHKESPLGDMSRAQIEKDKMFYIVRNQLWIAWKYLPLPRAAVENVAHICYYFWEALRKKALAPYLRGLGAAILSMPRVLMKERTPVSQTSLAKIDNLAYGEMLTDPAMLETFSPIAFRTLIWRKFVVVIGRSGNGRSRKENH